MLTMALLFYSFVTKKKGLKLKNREADEKGLKNVPRLVIFQTILLPRRQRFRDTFFFFT